MRKIVSIPFIRSRALIALAALCAAYALGTIDRLADAFSPPVPLQAQSDDWGSEKPVLTDICYREKSPR